MILSHEKKGMTGTGVSRKKACSLRESLASPKSIMKIGTWNVRTMYRIGKTAVVAREMRKYGIDVLGISECRWAGFGRMKTQTSETLYSGRDDDALLSGVAMLLSRKAASCLISWSPVNDRIITARFNSRYIRTRIVQVYAPTNDADEEAKDVFYEQVQNVLSKIPKHDIVILMEDWNAKVGDKQDGGEGVGRPAWTAWGKVREWGTLRRTVCKQQYGHHNNFVSTQGYPQTHIGITRHPHQEPDQVAE